MACPLIARKLYDPHLRRGVVTRLTRRKRLGRRARRQWIAEIPADHHSVAGLLWTRFAFLLKRRPTSVDVVHSTRADPDLPLARCQRRGDPVEIRAAELRLRLPRPMHASTPDGPGSRPGRTLRLGGGTQGWIAAPQLAALSLGVPGIEPHWSLNRQRTDIRITVRKHD